MPTPPELFRSYEGGELSREQFHAAMRLHQEDLIDEMVESRENPVAAWLEQLRNRAAAARLARRHGAALIREILGALGALPGFPPAHLLWNASHREVPLHCFFRSRRDPVFRVLKLDRGGARVRVTLEWGESAAPVREIITLAQGRFQRWELQERRES